MPAPVDDYLLIRCAAIRDALGVDSAPGAMLLRPDRSVLLAGSVEEAGQVVRERFEGPGIDRIKTIDRPGHLLIPMLVNAHTHLDLTHLGPLPFDGDFISWVDRIREGRHYDEVGIFQSTMRGGELSRRGGTAAVGDIAGVFSTVPMQALRESGMRGVSYVELFGQGELQANAIERMKSIAMESQIECKGSDEVRLGLQPHAPYSAGLDLFRAVVETAREFDLAPSTHLAETEAEIEFTKYATGAQAELIKRLGKWDDSIAPSGLHPVDHLAQVMAQSRDLSPGWTLAHLNYVDDDHISQLASWNATVVYCPRASAYFGHRNHRYRDMIEAGAKVALGTDSIIGLDTADRISIVDEMRLLYQRDHADGETLLKMATVNGAVALGVDPRRVSFQPTEETSPVPIGGAIALAIDPDSGIDPLSCALSDDRVFEVIDFRSIREV